jgi:hypothetical protein
MSVEKDETVVNSVYIAKEPGGSAQSRIPTGQPFYVVVKAKVGTSAWESGHPDRIHVFLRDITTFQIQLDATHATTLVPDFPTPDKGQVFSFGPVTAGPVDTIYQPVAVLAIGALQQEDSILAEDSILVGGLTVVTTS